MVRRAPSSEADRKQRGRSCPERAVRTPSDQEGVSREQEAQQEVEQEGARRRTVRRTPEQGKLHQVAKRVLNCRDAESVARRAKNSQKKSTK